MSRESDEPAAEVDKEAFASRWSRLKQEARQAPPPAEMTVDPKAPAPELPPVDKLTIDSDYRAFFHPKVDEGVRRTALKKLFSDPRFNVMDGLDVYIDDYSKTEPIPPEMMAGLRQAQNILAWAKEDEEQRAKEQRMKEQKALKEVSLQGEQPTPVAEVRLDVTDAAPVPPEDAGTSAKS